MIFRSIMMIAALAAPSLTLVKCGYLRTKIEDLPCKAAMTCAVIVAKKEPAGCTSTRRHGDQMMVLKNNHKTKKLFVTYSKTVKRIGGPATADVVTYGSIELENDGKSPYSLGCTIDNDISSEVYDMAFYTKVSACFSGECPAPPTPVAGVRPSGLACEAACAQNDPSCLKFDLPPVSAGSAIKGLDELQRSLSTTKAPDNIDISYITGLSNTISGTSDCDRSDIEIRASSAGEYSYKNFGSTCPIAVELLGKDYSHLIITFPGELAGTIKNNGNIFTMTSSGPLNSPSLTLQKRSTDDTETDPVTRITGFPDALILTGEKYYCAQIRWPR